MLQGNQTKEVVMAQDQDPPALPPPGPDPARKRLERLVGSWQITGHTLDSTQDNVAAAAP
jgi:hypothetical protein